MSVLYRLNTSAHRFWYKRFSTTDWKIVRFMGAEFTIKPSNYIDRRMWVERAYEKEQLERLLGLARSHGCDSFIDIGANFGLYSCIFGVSGAVKAVHSFECDPRNLYHLYGHLRMNELIEKVTVYPFPLGDTEKDIMFQMASAHSTGRSHVSAVGDSEKEGTLLRQRPLDDVLTTNNQKLVIKIDVEGYETAVLDGMKKLLQNNKAVMQVEIFDSQDEKKEMLAALGYKNLGNIGSDFYFSNF